jgi:hypothetical protein
MISLHCSLFPDGEICNKDRILWFYEFKCRFHFCHFGVSK